MLLRKLLVNPAFFNNPGSIKTNQVFSHAKVEISKDYKLVALFLEFLDHLRHSFIKLEKHSTTLTLSSIFSTETIKRNITQNLHIKNIQNPNAVVCEAVRRNIWRSGRLTQVLRQQFTYSGQLYSFYYCYF